MREDIGTGGGIEAPGPADRRVEIAGLAYAVLAAVAFGTVAIFAKYAYREGADSVPLLASRFAIAAALIALFRTVTRRRRSIPRRDLVRLVALGSLGYGFEATLFFVALEHAPAGTVALIFYSFPLWTTLIALATRLEPFRWGVLIALGLGTAGVSLIFTIDTGGLLGPLLALAAAVAVAVYFTLAQVVARDIPPLTSALWTAAGAAVTLTVLGLATAQDLPASALVYSGALGVVTAIAFVALFAAIDRIGSARSSIAAMLEPVTTVALAAVFLNEAITARIGIGTALIAAALPVLVATRPRSTAPAPDAL